MKSMTGFGRAQAALPDGTQVSITVRGVNHRFLDLSLKMRDDLGALEAAAQEARRRVRRARARRPLRPRLAARRGAPSLSTARRRHATRRSGGGSPQANGLPAELTARDLLSLPGSRPGRGGRGRARRSGRRSSTRPRTALADFDASRRREGEALKAALGTILDRLEAGISRVAEAREGLAREAPRAAPGAGRQARRGRPARRGAARAGGGAPRRPRRHHRGDRPLPRPPRRRRRRLVARSGPPGKRLDVLAQELHREANTSGAEGPRAAARRASSST